LKSKEGLDHIRGVLSLALQPGTQFSPEDLAYGRASKVSLAGDTALVAVVANHLMGKTSSVSLIAAS